jgi:hypothetical protein
MSASGTKRTLPPCRTMSAFGGKADIKLTRPRLGPVREARRSTALIAAARQQIFWKRARQRGTLIGGSLAQSGHRTVAQQCPLLGVKRTSRIQSVMSAFDPYQTSESLLSPSAQGPFVACSVSPVILGRTNLQLLMQRAFLPSQMDLRPTMTLQPPRAGDFPLG